MSAVAVFESRGAAIDKALLLATGRYKTRHPYARMGTSGSCFSCSGIYVGMYSVS